MGTSEQVDRLPDQQAIAVLALVLERQKLLPDATRLRELDAQVSAAAAESDIAQGVPAVTESVSDGELARSTLSYLLAETPALSSVIDRAITLSATDDGTRFEPVTMAVGALVVLALQTDVKLERNTAGKWRLAVHKKAMSDSALGAVLTRLIASYTGRG